jgi:aconitate decarboxylase
MFGQGSGKTPAYLVEEVTKEFGVKWQTWGVRVKPYAAMAGTHPTVDCVRKLQKEHPEQMKDLEAITSIKLEMGEAAFHHGGWKAVRPLTSTGAQMSNAYVAATQLVDRQVLPTQFRHDKLESDEVWSLVERTSCEYNKDFDGRYNQRVTITFKDKPTVTAMVNAARGVDPALTNEEIVEKWRLITKGGIDDERRERIEKLCLNFEAMEDVTKLLDLLVGATENPIA